MKGRAAWKYLIPIFAAFWLLFAVVLVVSQFPFYIISLALTTVLVLSVLVIVLAWGYTHGW